MVYGKAAWNFFSRGKNPGYSVRKNRMIEKTELRIAGFTEWADPSKTPIDDDDTRQKSLSYSRLNGGAFTHQSNQHSLSL
jgi:hypothetical protein